MINHKEAEILAYLIKRSPQSTYIVIEPQEILDNITEKITKDELLEQLTDLSSRDAILIRIVNMDECVLAPTPKAKVLIDELREMEEAKNMINTVKDTISPVIVEEEPTTKKGFFGKKVKTITKTVEKQVPSKVIIDYKKIFMSAFWGAVSGGGIIAIIMLIIGLCL